MTNVSANKKAASLEHDALGDLGEHVANIGGISPLTKAMINETIGGIQNTLYLAWGLDPTGVDPGHFQISDEDLQQHAVEMQTQDGQWVAVNYPSLDKLPGDMLVRLIYHDPERKNDGFFEANGRTEFLLATKGFEYFVDEIDTNKKTNWVIWYQVQK